MRTFRTLGGTRGLGQHLWGEQDSGQQGATAVLLCELEESSPASQVQPQSHSLQRRSVMDFSPAHLHG